VGFGRRAGRRGEQVHGRRERRATAAFVRALHGDGQGVALASSDPWCGACDRWQWSGCLQDDQCVDGHDI
jgi:hypothetical protein